jgi:hypothetical protein
LLRQLLRQLLRLLLRLLLCRLLLFLLLLLLLLPHPLLPLVQPRLLLRRLPLSRRAFRCAAHGSGRGVHIDSGCRLPGSPIGARAGGCGRCGISGGTS